MIDNTSKYHDALVAAAVKLSPHQAIHLLDGLYEQGALDLDARNAQGFNFLEAFVEQSAMTPPMVEFLHSIGRTDLYAERGQHDWRVMTHQVTRWLKLDQGALKKDKDLALSLMIQKVSPKWWAQYDSENDDEGSVLISKLASLRGCSRQSFEALLKRGVDPQGRYGAERKLAAASIREAQGVDIYLNAGGTLDVLVCNDDSYPVPLWRHLSQHSPNEAGFKIERETHSDTENSEIFNNDRNLREVLNLRSNLSKMFKRIRDLPDWPHTMRYDGTPAWLWMLGVRKEVLREFLVGKRDNINFTERDPLGRSAWFWNLSASEPQFSSLKRLNEWLPIETMSHDKQGNGLIVQLVQHAVSFPHKKDSMKWFNPLPLLDWEKTPDKSKLLDGLSNVDFSPLFYFIASTEPFEHPKIFIHLISHPDTRAAMNPSQRGQCLCAAFIYYKRLPDQPDWFKQMDSLLHECETLGMVWPGITPFMKAMDTMKLTSAEDKAFQDTWQTNLEAQTISNQTASIHPGNTRMGRRI